jgi:hypothetical protein
MGECIDISRSGVRMQISDPIPALTKICFKSDSLALNGSGTVRHCKKQRAKYIIGIEFAGGLQWVATGTAQHSQRIRSAVTLDEVVGE